jgi:hypothetical protein
MQRIHRLVALFLLAAACFLCAAPRRADAQLALPTPLTTTRLRQLCTPTMGSLQGIQFNRACGRAFQDFVLRSMPGGVRLPENFTPFGSVERGQRTNFMFNNVIPDAVTASPAGTGQPYGMAAQFPNSTFVEVKAVKGILRLSYGRWQILGMLDALRKSPAARSSGPRRAFPNMVFVATADTIISPEVITFATKENIVLWWAVVLEIGNQLVVGSPLCLNCTAVYVTTNRIPLPVPLGIPGALLPAVPVTTLDHNTLDDSFVGTSGPFAGPGNTSPNQ